MRNSPKPAVRSLAALCLATLCLTVSTGCSTGTAADTGQDSAPSAAGARPGQATTAAPTAFTPYVSATTPAAADTAGSPDTYNLAFVVADGDSCTPTWGGTSAFDSTAVKSRVDKLKSSGADVRVSFGGAAGTELALACHSVGELADAYAKVLDTVGATKADFDIEGDALTDSASITLRDKALAQLQQERQLDVTYTLPVMPDGLEKSGTAVLADAAAQKVSISAVNIMAMNYGSSYDGNMGDYAQQSAEAAHTQIADALGLSSGHAWRSLHITAMVGVNDVSGETFTLDDATRLRAFAQRNGVGALSMWATFRDQACADGVSTSKASDTCSGVDQTAGAFAKALAG